MVSEQQAAELVASIFRATRMPIADAAERQARRREFGEELMRIARTLEHAEEIARRCRESFDEFPTIHQLHGVAAAVLRDAEPAQAPAESGRAGCIVCGGSGWQRTSAPGGGVFRGLLYAAVRPCACRGAT